MTIHLFPVILRIASQLRSDWIFLAGNKYFSPYHFLRWQNHFWLLLCNVVSLATYSSIFTATSVGTNKGFAGFVFDLSDAISRANTSSAQRHLIPPAHPSWDTFQAFWSSSRGPETLAAVGWEQVISGNVAFLFANNNRQSPRYKNIVPWIISNISSFVTHRAAWSGWHYMATENIGYRYGTEGDSSQRDQMPTLLSLSSSSRSLTLLLRN